MTAATVLVILCGLAALTLAFVAGREAGLQTGKITERRRCIRKLTGHFPGPGSLRDTWLRAMLDEV